MPVSSPATDTRHPPAAADLASLFPHLLRLRVTVVLQDAFRPPSFPGSLWRGVLGHGLRRALCVTGAPRCGGCLLEASCFYSRFFESPAPDGALARRYSHTPHPWVLEVTPEERPRQRAAGERLSFGLLVLGESVRQLPYLVHALQQAGRRGLGRAHVPFEIAVIERETVLGSGRWQAVYHPGGSVERDAGTAWPALPAAPPRAVLHLATPLRMKRYGDLVGPAEFDLPLLLRALRERITTLHGLYGERRAAAPVLPDPADTPPQAPGGQRLRWFDWTRFSSRQRTRMRMGGLTGALELDTAALADWWPWLWAGQWLHVGKQTAMGLGRYRLHPA